MYIPWLVLMPRYDYFVKSIINDIIYVKCYPIYGVRNIILLFRNEGGHIFHETRVKQNIVYGQIYTSGTRKQTSSESKNGKREFFY